MYIDIDKNEILLNFSDQDLIDELIERKVGNVLMLNELIEKLWLNKREGKPYDELIDKIIYEAIGKIV